MIDMVTVTPLVRFEGLPGEFSQHDFREVRCGVTYQDGAETKVHFSTSRLKYSRGWRSRSCPMSVCERWCGCSSSISPPSAAFRWSASASKESGGWIAWNSGPRVEGRHGLPAGASWASGNTACASSPRNGYGW